MYLDQSETIQAVENFPVHVIDMPEIVTVSDVKVTVERVYEGFWTAEAGSIFESNKTRGACLKGIERKIKNARNAKRESVLR